MSSNFELKIPSYRNQLRQLFKIIKSTIFAYECEKSKSICYLMLIGAINMYDINDLKWQLRSKLEMKDLGVM